MNDLGALLQRLAGAGVEFILVGGVAAAVHGSARITQDVHVVYARTPDNLARLAETLAPLHPYLRGAPPGLPFLWDARTLAAGLNFTLDTDLGPLDLLGEIAGGGRHPDLLPQTIVVQAFGVTCRCLDLEPLIRVKRAAGRPKDLEAIAELNEILALRRG